MISVTEAPFSHAVAGLHVLADDDPRWGIGPVAQAEAACKGGASVIQLRIKFATDRLALEWAETIRALTREAGVHFIVNDRFDLALAAGADGVHLGQDDLPPGRIPKHARERLTVGLSTHDLAQARAAAGEPVDYVAFGPVYGSQSKLSPYSARGLELLKNAVRLVAPLPLVAIGGLSTKNLADVLAAGAAGAAVISAVAGSPDPAAATRELVEAGKRAVRNPLETA
jgi:thiamine-phosphate pyrophosphorylase